ncbi:MAG TPA: hypothetical protein VGP93_13735 [Polyangiaceae bacterium]|jgi:hypothetical protein|nr:hypothetical protein [Polyangiaceae bacterium]
MAAANDKPTRAEIKRAAERLQKAIEQHGLLLKHDARLPCATQLIAGGSVPGSWWSHEKGSLIYEVLSSLDDDEVAYPKLLAGKVTLVHRRLWPALVAAARSGGAWQYEGLKLDARALLTRVQTEKRLRSDRLELAPRSRKVGILVSELESRLLVYSEGEHTEAGHHARVLFSYEAWQKKKRVRDLPDAERALEILAGAARSSLPERELSRLLPWEKSQKPKARPRARSGVESRLRSRP